jgi:hypothetical protein
VLFFISDSEFESHVDERAPTLAHPPAEDAERDERERQAEDVRVADQRSLLVVELGERCCVEAAGADREKRVVEEEPVDRLLETLLELGVPPASRADVERLARGDAIEHDVESRPLLATQRDRTAGDAVAPSAALPILRPRRQFGPPKRRGPHSQEGGEGRCTA